MLGGGHVPHNPRMTLMFCAFSGNPMILRLFGKARVVHMNDAKWQSLYALFSPVCGARQIFDVAIDRVQTSCGFGVPLMRYQGDRDTLKVWAEKKGQQGIADYWAKKNQVSLDGIDSHILANNLSVLSRSLLISVVLK